MEFPRSVLEHAAAENVAGPQALYASVNVGKRLPLSGPERRGRVRVAARLPLTIKYGGIYESASEAADISARGMFFVFRQRLEIGTAIELVFRLPRRVIGIDGIWLRCPAEVVRVEEGLPQGEFGIAARIKSHEVLRVS